MSSTQSDSDPADTSVSQLVYRSVSLVGARSGLQMSDILAEARPRNAAAGVTGALTVVDGHFVQIIEGPEGALDDLVARLVRDRRHRDLRVLDRRKAKTRTFGDWDMVSPRLVPTEAQEIRLLLEQDRSSLSDFIPVLIRAVGRPDAVLEGIETPPDRATASSSATPVARRFRVDPEA
ncbi:hypothetical protein BH09PSE1_BH09PSE1_08630 [soil metagenome]